MGTFRVVGILASFFAMKLVIDGAGEARWGEIVFLLSGLNLLGIFTLFGQENYLLALPASSGARVRQAVVNALVLSTAVSVVLALGLWAITGSVGETAIRILMLLPSFSILRIALRHYQKLEARLSFGLLNGETYLYMGLLGFLWLFGFPSTRPDLVDAAGALIVGASVIAMIPLLSIGGSVRLFDADQWRDGTPFLLGGSLLLLMGWLDTFLIGLFRTSAEVGLYNVIFKLASVATIFLSLTNAIVAPRLGELYRSDPPGFQQLVLVSNRVNIVVSGILVFATVLFFRQLVAFFGVDASGTDQLWLPGLVLLGSYFVNSACGNVGYVLQMTGRTGAFNRLIGQAAFINVALNFGLIPSFGIAGASLATGLSMIWWNIGGWLFVRRQMGVRLC